MGASPGKPHITGLSVGSTLPKHSEQNGSGEEAGLHRGMRGEGQAEAELPNAFTLEESQIIAKRVEGPCMEQRVSIELQNLISAFFLPYSENHSCLRSFKPSVLLFLGESLMSQTNL